MNNDIYYINIYIYFFFIIQIIIIEQYVYIYIYIYIRGVTVHKFDSLLPTTVLTSQFGMISVIHFIKFF